MEIEDLKLISKLIHKYGIKEIDNQVKINSAFLEYICDPSGQSMHSEDNNSQIITNGRSSIFYLEPKLIDFDLINTNTNNPISNLQSNIDLKKQFERASSCFKNKITTANLVKAGSYAGLLIGNSNSAIPNKISLQDLKMIDLLIKGYKIYISQISYMESIIHVEGKNGFAYVLTKHII